MSFMLSIIYAECREQAHYAQCLYAECRYAECRGAHYSKCLRFPKGNRTTIFIYFW